MTGAHEGPYEVVYAGQTVLETATLPVQARRALHECLAVLAADPWNSARYHPRHPAEMRSAPFGDWGMVMFVISEKRHRVIVAQVTWAG